MAYQPIKVIAAETSADGHTNRVTDFDSTPQSNKICYRDGLPYSTAVPNGQNTRGPRRVDLNGLFYLFSSNLFELQQGNFPTYNSAIVGAGKPLPDGYPQGAVLWHAAGGYFVRSLVADNTESDLTDTTKWAKITVSAADLASELSGKVDLASGVAQADVDYVVESYVNGTSWYRVYKSGWCEQGGYVATTANVTYSETFLKTFADTNYSMQLTQFGVMSNYNANPIVLTKNTSGFEFVGQETGTFWEAKGYIA